MELTRSGESDSHPSLIIPAELLPHATYKLRSATSWTSNDLSVNVIAEVGTNPYTEGLKVELSRTRVIDNDNAVGALGF